MNLRLMRSPNHPALILSEAGNYSAMNGPRPWIPDGIPPLGSHFCWTTQTFPSLDEIIPFGILEKGGKNAGLTLKDYGGIHDE